MSHLLDESRTLRKRIRGARGFFSEILRLAEEQDFELRTKDDGVLLLAPLPIRRSGFEKIFVRDPHNDSHAQKVIMERLRKSGLKFPDIEHQEKTLETRNASMNQTRVTVNPIKAIPNAAPASPPTPITNLFSIAAAKVDDAINALAELGGVLKQIEADSQKVEQLKQLLKTLT